MKDLKNIIVLFVGLLCICTFSYAATTGVATLSSEKLTAIKGNETSITVSAQDSKNINAITFDNIVIYKADGETVSTEVKVKEIKTTENTSKYVEGDTTTLTYNGTATINSVEMCTITLTTDATVGTYIVKIPNMIVYNAEDDSTNVGTKTVELTVKEDTTTVDGEEKKEEENPSNTNEEQKDNSSNTNSNNSNNSSTSNSSNNTKTNTNSTTKKTTKIPQTGIGFTTITILIVIMGISVISLISYKKYKNI